jgi:hypothetical protein
LGCFLVAAMTKVAAVTAVLTAALEHPGPAVLV